MAYLGPAVAAVGLGICFGILRINKALGQVTKRNEKLSLIAADARLGLLRQMVDTMKCVKFFSWESSYLEMLTEKRVEEVLRIRKYRAVQQFSLNLARSAPVFSCIFSFLALAALGGESLPFRRGTRGYGRGKIRSLGFREELLASN